MFLKGFSEKVNNFESKDNFSLQEISLDQLEPSTNNFYGIREIEELSESIREQGLLHNLVVRDKGNGKYEILSGERRYHALKKLGALKAPCKVIKDMDDVDAEILLIQANSKTRELTPKEKMQSIKRLEALYKQKKNEGIEIQGKVRDVIGKDLGLSGTQVGRYMKIDKKLDEELKDDLDKDKLTVSQAEIVANLMPAEQKEIAKQIKDLDPKESKEEINILIEGIKQPLERHVDKELLKETYESNEPIPSSNKGWVVCKETVDMLEDELDQARADNVLLKNEISNLKKGVNSAAHKADISLAISILIKAWSNEVNDLKAKKIDEQIKLIRERFGIS